ncbi:MAG: LytR/AlgR family response regulator transcription factor [Methanosarcina sp.]
MITMSVKKYLGGKFPQNFLIQKHLAGGLIIAIFSFLFLSLYKPLGVKASKKFSFELTMALYSSFTGITAFLAIIFIKSIKWFEDEDEWTVLKEFLASLFVISATCLSVYFLGFVVEDPSFPRWNFNTFFDSFTHAFLIGVIPFTFFTLVNYRYLFPHKIKTALSENVDNTGPAVEKSIKISSQLKKESLSLYPSELVYAESDGNYVIFYLVKENQLKKEIIRNSINNIEQQLSDIPFLFRTHRAFIVNLKKVTGKHGTTLGYNLKLSGTETRIPVSRNNTREFNKVLSELNG